jgi:hypothetical protein
MSVPIVLSITDEQKEVIGAASAVTLVAPTGTPLAILRKYYVPPPSLVHLLLLPLQLL